MSGRIAEKKIWWSYPKKTVFGGLKNPFLCLFTYSSESACLPAHVWRPEDSLEVSDDNFGVSVLSSRGYISDC